MSNLRFEEDDNEWKVDRGKWKVILFRTMKPGPLQQQSYAFALDVVLFCKSLMEENREYVLSKQLMKAGTSVAANIEEAQQAQSKSDFISKLAIALKEAYESRFWLRLMFDAKYGNPDEVQKLQAQVQSIIPMLVASIKTAKNNEA